VPVNEVNTAEKKPQGTSTLGQASSPKKERACLCNYLSVKIVLGDI